MMSRGSSEQRNPEPPSAEVDDPVTRAADDLIRREALRQLDLMEAHLDDDDWRMEPVPDFADCIEVATDDASDDGANDGPDQVAADDDTDRAEVDCSGC